jgi:hypothetical protein
LVLAVPLAHLQSDIIQVVGAKHLFNLEVGVFRERRRGGNDFAARRPIRRKQGNVVHIGYRSAVLIDNLGSEASNPEVVLAEEGG